MKKLLLLFGVLDIISIVRSYTPIRLLLTDLDIIAILNLLLFLLLGLSAYFLLKQRKAGVWLTYGQFPLRLAFLVLSFGFLFPLYSMSGGPSEAYKILLAAVLVIEFARLLLTILIHRKFYTR